MVVDRPTTADLADWLGIDETTAGSSLSWALDAALEAQDAACWTAPYTRSLHVAALRRAARILASKQAPLGSLDLGDLGATPIPRWDADIETNEAAHRRGSFA